MSQIIIQDTYPDNSTTSAAVVNNNNVAIAAGANSIDATNVRVEGIDTRNVYQYAMIEKTVKQYNGYQLASWPALPAAGAWYPFYTEASPFGGKGAGGKEWPINHDATGATNTAIGAGTKLLINQSINEGDIIRFRWMINLYDIQTNNGSNGADASSQLIYAGARPMGGVNGSGVGEWCALVYPKINTTSAALLDANFVNVGTLGNVVVVDPATQIPGIGSVVPVTGGRFDHCTFIPQYIMSAGNAPGAYAWSTYLFEQQMLTGEFWMRAHLAAGPTTLYGVQLYFSGPWRMDTDGAVPAGPGLYLENVDCNPSVPHYGVSGSYGFERAYVEATVYRNTST